MDLNLKKLSKAPGEQLKLCELEELCRLARIARVTYDVASDSFGLDPKDPNAPCLLAISADELVSTLIDRARREEGKEVKKISEFLFGKDRACSKGSKR